MKLKMFSVLDTKTGAFGNPFVSLREESAIREFSDAVNDGSNPNNQWFRHPEDFSLYFLGEFDTSTGVINPISLIQNLITASALKALAPMNLPSMNGSDKLAVVN